MLCLQMLSRMLGCVVMDSGEEKRIMIEYLKLKVHQEDWHGVADAANDLRELEVYIEHEKTSETFSKPLDSESVKG